MKVPEHVAFSFLLAQLGVHQQYGWPGTGLVIGAGCLPDLDGIGIIGGWRFYQRYHRILGHGLPMTLLGPAALASLGSWILHVGPFLVLWSWLQVSLLLHLFTDVSFYSWPVQLAWPLSKRGWAGGLLTWNDLVPTILLYGGTASSLAGKEDMDRFGINPRDVVLLRLAGVATGARICLGSLACGRLDRTFPPLLSLANGRFCDLNRHERRRRGVWARDIVSLG